MSRRALAVGAHPDDVELMMAGTLALLKVAGWEVAIGIIAKGDCGSKSLTRAEITSVRRKEAEKSAAVLGAQIFFMGQNDLEIDVNPETRRIVTEVVRKAAPDVVLTHPPMDYMTDHEFTSRLVRDACFAATTPNYETGSSDPAPALAKIPFLYYCDPLEGKDLFGSKVVPQFVVDISTQMEMKKSMLTCHASQREWLRVMHGIDQYVIEMETWARLRGEPHGFEFAEGFRQHLGHAFPHNNLIEETLKGLAAVAGCG
ncbi:MAG: PIG-L family deacetylase [Candidatus Omnitrophica bacterium]|nr:PIG-L family deacetylase [Candidatus Omnitrophota bacterium]